MTIAIRAFGTDDRAGWDPLWRDYLAFYDQDLDQDVTNETWRRLLDLDTDMHGLCAVDGTRRLVGIVHYLFHPVTWSVAPRCYLEDLFVAEAARGSGVGRKLIEAVYAAADARGADQVYWLTQEDNRAARALYDRVARFTTFIKYQR